MAHFVRSLRLANFIGCRVIRRMSSDSQLPDYGSGIRMGGGSGGSIREAGGSMGIREAAWEDQYFRNVSAQQLDELHKHMTDEIHVLQTQLGELEAAINVKKQKLRQLKELCPKEG